MNDEPTTEPQPEAPQPRRWPRSPPAAASSPATAPTGMLAGVASGLGRHFDVDPVIFRIAFGVSLFFGGFGALAYIALALFLPGRVGRAAGQELPLGAGRGDRPDRPLPRPGDRLGFWDGGGAWLGLWLIVPAAIAVGAYAILKDRGGPGSAGGVIAGDLHRRRGGHRRSSCWHSPAPRSRRSASARSPRAWSSSPASACLVGAFPAACAG